MEQYCARLSQAYKLSKAARNSEIADLHFEKCSKCVLTKFLKFNDHPSNGCPIDPSNYPLVMPLDQVICRQGTYWFYSTLLEDIFLNEKHAIFLKIFNFNTLSQIF